MFKTFLTYPNLTHDSYLPPSRLIKCSPLDYVSQQNNNFIHPCIDTYLRFESITSDHQKVCDNLGIQYTESTNAFARLKFHVGDLKVDMISTTREGLYDNLRQRDFTINAVAQSVTGQFYDPFHGLDDIKAKILRTPANRSSTGRMRGILFNRSDQLKCSCVDGTSSGLIQVTPAI